MAEIPKIVHRRLQDAMTGRESDGGHLDANALNAFAEQALSLTERENVLAHLALCANCRDVVLTALPEIVAPEPVVVAEPQIARAPVDAVRRQRKALLWPSLRWGMLAAGVVTAVVLARSGFEHLSSSPRNRATSTVQQQASAEMRSQTALGPSGIGTGHADAKSDVLASDGLNKRQANASNSSQPATAASSGKHVIGGQKTVSTPAPLVAENRASSVDRPFSSGSQAAAIVRAKPALGTQAQAQNIPPGESSRLDETPSSPSGALKESPRWEVEAGSLKRSFDGGVSWETVVQPGNFLLCYVSRGGQVWAGGQGGTLLHSADGGADWSAVTVSVGGKVFNSDINSIGLQDPAVVVLTTTEGQQLASRDGGKTWEQK